MAAFAGVVWLLRGDRGPWFRARRPDPARGVVLVLASGLGGEVDLAQTPAFARLAAAGRRFERAFASEPDPRAAREAVLAGLTDAFRARGAAVADVGPDLALTGPPGEAGAGPPLEAWLRAQASGRFLAVARLGERPAPPLAGVTPTVDPEHRAPALPRIASGDLEFADRPGGVVQPPEWSGDARRRAEAAWLERARAADADLERLRQVLERAAPDAALVLLGDAPPDLGAHGVLSSGDSLFEATLRVGLVVTARGMARPGRAARTLASSLDVPPTLLDLAGLPPERGFPGASLVPVLADPSATLRDEALSSMPRQAGRLGRSVRSPRYRYSEWPDGSEELYDHAADPGENVNLAANAAERETMRALGRAFEPRPAPSAAPPPGRRARNVLLIVVDDLNTRVGAWGAPVQTPNLDRLAARGIRFDHAYVQVSMCSPSRASFLTGWRPERTGVWDNMDPARPAGAVPLQEHFGARGYFTASVGKIYHQPEEFRWDFRDGAGRPVEETPDTGARAGDSGGMWEKAAGSDADQPDGLRARKAAEILEQPRARPLFLAVGLVRPHLRWIAPARYFGLYPPETIVAVPAPADDLADVPAIAIKTKPQPLPGLPLLGREPPGLVPDPAFRRQAIAAYQACVTFVDAQVGLLLDVLDRRDLWKDTVVVLVGDNGFLLGEHGGFYRKDSLFEEAVRVPLLVAAPDVRQPGAVVEAPVEMLDLYPTVTDLAGAPPVPGLDGRSLRPFLADREAPGWEAAVSYRRVRPPERAWSLRTDAVRYTLWPDGSEELYEHATDPLERDNLAGRPERARLKARLRARLVELVATRPAAKAD